MVYYFSLFVLAYLIVHGAKKLICIKLIIRNYNNLLWIMNDTIKILNIIILLDKNVKIR